MIGYRVPEFDETNIDLPALNIIGQLLFARNAPLFQKLVVDEQLVDFVSGGYTDRRDPYLFTIMSRIKNIDNMGRVEQEIYDAIEDLKNNQIAPARLDEIKSFLRYSFAMSLNTASSVARTVSQFIQLTGDFNTVNKLFDLYDSVTPEDVQRVARKYFTPATRSVVTLAQEEIQQ